MEIKLAEEIKCKRCGHKWRPRQKDIRVCPKCHSAYWNKEKRENAKS